VVPDQREDQALVWLLYIIEAHKEKYMLRVNSVLDPFSFTLEKANKLDKVII
jgi:hypothetical protein